jgi:peptidoglycan/xylan/chitin deacetylase (PgdA/CDA1 family)
MWKESGKRALARAGGALTRFCRTRRDEAFAIFNYHRITAPVAGVRRPTINVPPERFRAQIRGLQERGYVIRPLAEMLRIHRLGLPLPPRTVVLTFDDGFTTVYTEAWPILKELEAPATVFLSTAYLDSDCPFPFDAWGDEFRDRLPAESWRPLRSQQCGEMLASGLIALGAHTHTHQDFRGRPAEFAEDMRTCTGLLQARFGLEEVGFAFPFGAADEDLMDATRQSGVTCALMVRDGLIDPRSDPFGWPRFTPDEWDTADTLMAKREGWYGRLLAPYRAVRRLVVRQAGATGWVPLVPPVCAWEEALAKPVAPVRKQERR